MERNVRQEVPRADERHPRRADHSAAKGHPEEVAAAVAFLLSDEATFVSGIDILVASGLLANFRTNPIQLSPSDSPSSGRRPAHRRLKGGRYEADPTAVSSTTRHSRS
jgi:hypothetical protein